MSPLQKSIETLEEYLTRLKEYTNINKLHNKIQSNLTGKHLFELKKIA